MRKNDTFVHIHDNTFACKRQRYRGPYTVLTSRTQKEAKDEVNYYFNN